MRPKISRLLNILTGHTVYDAFVLQDVAGFAEVITDVRLSADPRDVPSHAVG